MKEVKDFYDWYQYPKLIFFTKKQEKRYNKLLRDILSYGNLTFKDLKNKRVLDAGCGTGEKAVFLSKFSFKVSAIDFSKKQIAFAKKLDSKNKVEFYVRDLVKDDLTDLGEFDVIFVIGSLPVIKNSYQAFKNITPLLKKNGIIILGLYHRYIRLRYRINRFLLHLYSKDFKKLENFLFNSRLTKNIRKAPKNSLYDRYIVPYENYHTLSQIKKWFRENNIEFIDSSKNVKGIEFLKIFKKKSFFFVSGKKL